MLMSISRWEAFLTRAARAERSSEEFAMQVIHVLFVDMHTDWYTSSAAEVE